jgi:hypothetical protein
MLETWTSKNGAIPMLLMSDEHLINAVRQKLLRLSQLRKMANVKMDKPTAILFGMSNVSEKDVAYKTRSEIQDLYPLFATLFYRGLATEEIMLLLHEIVPDPRGDNVICLPLQDESEDVPF